MLVDPTPFKYRLRSLTVIDCILQAMCFTFSYRETRAFPRIILMIFNHGRSGGKSHDSRLRGLFSKNKTGPRVMSGQGGFVTFSRAADMEFVMAENVLLNNTTLKCNAVKSRFMCFPLGRIFYVDDFPPK